MVARRRALVLGRDELTDFLPWAAPGGVPSASSGRWSAGAAGRPTWSAPLRGADRAARRRDRAAAATVARSGSCSRPPPIAASAPGPISSSTRAVDDRQYGHHLLVLGLIVWGTARFRELRRVRASPADQRVVVVGLLLIANMSLTVRPQLTYLVVFSLARLFLLIRFHTLEEQGDWLRRRIGDPSAISSAVPARRDRVHHRGDHRLAGADGAASRRRCGRLDRRRARLVEWSSRSSSSSGRRHGRSFGPTFGDVGARHRRPVEHRRRAGMPGHAAGRVRTRTATGARSPTTCSRCAGGGARRPHEAARRPATCWPAPSDDVDPDGRPRARPPRITPAGAQRSLVHSRSSPTASPGTTVRD